MEVIELNSPERANAQGIKVHYDIVPINSAPRIKEKKTPRIRHWATKTTTALVEYTGIKFILTSRTAFKYLQPRNNYPSERKSPFDGNLWNPQRTEKCSRMPPDFLRGCTNSQCWIMIRRAQRICQELPKGKFRSIEMRTKFSARKRHTGYW